MGTTSTPALEVLTNILPIRLRLRECLCQEYVRMNRKPTNHPIYSLVGDPGGPPEVLTHQTPVNMMKAALRNTCKQLPVGRVEKFPGYDKDAMNTKVIHSNIIAWSNLGNAGNRTREQIIESNRVAAEYLSNLPSDSIIGFTDGSALGNPGPCGAGAAIHLSGMDSHPILCNKQGWHIGQILPITDYRYLTKADYR